MADEQIIFSMTPRNGAVEIAAVGGTYRLRSEFKARGYQYSGDLGWTKTVAMADAKGETDWMQTVPTCVVLVSNRLVFRAA